MRCRLAERQIPDWIAGHLAEEQRRALADHVHACAHCRRHAENVRLIYALPVVDPWTFAAGRSGSPSLELRPEVLSARADPRSVPVDGPVSGPGPAAARTASRPTRWTWRVAAAVVVGFLAFLWLQRAGHDGPSSPALLALPLTAITIELPPFPRALAAGWVESRAEAEQQSRFAGRPLLVEYAVDFCPLCQEMQRVLESPEGRMRLREFVLLRQGFDRESLARLARPPLPDRMPLPPIFEVRYEELATEARGGFTTIEGLDEVLDEWRAVEVTAQASPPRVPLSVTQFQAAVASLDAVPQLLAERRFDEAHLQLATIEALGQTHATGFAALAIELRTQIDAQLAREVDRIQRLAQGSRAARAQARALTQRLLAEAGTLPVAQPLRALLDR